MKKIYISLLMAVLIVVLAACGNSNQAAENEANTDSVETVVVEHDLGSTEVTKNPDNVVVFDFGSLDTLDFLGVDVVGVPQTNVPSYLEEYAGNDYENVGSLKEPDFEKIAEINPGLIIISARQAELYDQLAEIAPTIFLDLDITDYMDSFKQNASILGEVFAKEAEVEEALVDIEESIVTVKEQAEENGHSALIILANDDKISAYGPSSRFGFIHDVLGVEAVDDGIEASTHGMNVSFEYVVDQDPEFLYVIDRSAAVGGETPAKQLVENQLVERTQAYKNDNIYYLDPDYWYLSGGGLVSVPEMINEIKASLE